MRHAAPPRLKHKRRHDDGGGQRPARSLSVEGMRTSVCVGASALCLLCMAMIVCACVGWARFSTTCGDCHNFVATFAAWTAVISLLFQFRYDRKHKLNCKGLTCSET